MARIKNNITKSGASFLNERTRLKNTQQNNQPYIPNGTNVENLSIDKKYNDENTINFDNLSKYSTPQAYFNQYQNDRNSISEQLATPSTLPDLEFSLDGNNNFFNNQSAIIEKYLKKVNIIENKYVPFDNEKSENIENNNIYQDFNNGEGEYSFLDTNLYEETSIEIELDNPVDIILQNTAYIQKESFINEPAVNKNTYNFTSLNNSNYDIRKNAPINVPRLNTPFVIYNFDKKCWEYRGMPKPNVQINKTNTQKYSGKLDNITIPANQNINILPDVIKGDVDAIFPDLYNYDFQDFKKYFEKYLLHQNPLTNVPIINPRVFDDVQSSEPYSGISLPTSQFGFPIEKKFHAFQDNLLNLSKYINKSIIIDRISWSDLNVELLSEINNPQQFSLTNIFVDGFNASLNFYLLKQEKLSSQKLMPENNDKKYNPFKYNTTFQSWQLPTFQFPDNNLIYRVYAEKDTEYSTNLLIGNTNDVNYKLDDFLSEIPEEEVNSKRSIITFSNAVFHNTEGTQFSEILRDNCDKFIISDNTNNNLNLMTSDYVGKIKLFTYVKKPNFDNSVFNSHIFNKQIELPTGLNFYDITSSTRDFLNNLNGKDFINSIGQNKNLLLNKTDDEFVYIRRDLLDPRTNTLESPDDNPNLLFAIENSPNIWEYPDDKLSHFVSTYKIDKKSNYSPYVLSPSDNISICLSISPLMISELIKQQCKIKSGKIKLTLYGYQKKNNQIFTDDTSLKQNLNSNIIDDRSIVTDDYSNIGYLSEYIDTFNDRIFQGTFNDDVNPRKLNETTETTSSKILSGKSYIPYTKLEIDVNKKWIYDNDEVFPKILKLLLAENNQNPNINKYLTSYRGTIDTNNPPPITTNFDKVDIEYFDFNIAAAITPFKLDFKDLSGANLSTAIAQIQVEFADIIEELINSFPVLGALLAASFILEQLSTGDFINLNKRYNFSCYYNNRKYGQFADMMQQRLFTTEMSRDINNLPVIEYVLEQKFINNTTGVEITNLSDSLLVRNKSKNLQLIDSGFKSITTEGVITPWDVNDFFNLKHVAYNDAMTEIFI